MIYNKHTLNQYNKVYDKLFMQIITSCLLEGGLTIDEVTLITNGKADYDPTI